MLRLFPVVLFFAFGCSGSSSRLPDASLLKLQERFEKQWGEKSAAGDSVRLALAALPGRNEYILYCRAWKHAGRHNLAQALKTADSLVMGYPAFEKGIYLRANLRLENRDTSGSLSDFDRCLKKNPAFFECRMNRGSLFFVQKMADLAFLDFREAVKLRPENAEARLNLGNAHFALGQADSACVQWKTAASAGSAAANEISNKLCNPVGQ